MSTHARLAAGTAPAAVARPQPLLGFFLLSHGWSWAFWWLVVASGENVWSSAAPVFLFLGGAGPLLAGVTMTWRTGGRAGLRELGRRIADPRRIGRAWWIVILAVPAVAMAGGVALAGLLGADASVDATQAVAVATSPLALLAFAGTVLLLGPVPEEIGWRGYLLDALQSRFDAVSSSLLLGLAWSLWHLPLFFMPGYFVDGAPEPVLFTAAILANSLLYTWIHNNTRRSVLAAILFHFMINFVGMLFDGSPAVEWSRTAVTAAIAALVIAAGFGWRSFRPVAGGGSACCP